MMEMTEDIIQCYNNFKGIINNSFPEVMMFDDDSINSNNNRSIVRVTMKKQMMISDIIDKMEEIPFVKVLYASCDKRRCCYRRVIYSLPYNGKMFVMNVSSTMFGIVDNFIVTFYRSLDIMFNNIRKEYFAIQKSDYIILEKEQPTDLFSHFS